MARGVINSQAIISELAKNQKLKSAARQAAMTKFEQEKDSLVNNIINDPISEEIAEGPDADNSSGALGGYGNLYSFLGFDSGSSPISDLIAFLERYLRFPTKNDRQVSSDGIIYSWRINLPVESDLLGSGLDTPWGQNWVLGVVNGMANFKHYLFKEDGIRASRSGTGIQVKGTITKNRIKSSRPRQYIFKYLNKFKRRLERK